MGQLDKDQLAAGSVQLWSPHRALSGAKAPSSSLSLSHTHIRTQAHARAHACKHASVRVGLAEISLMTLERENDASSSSHPEPLSLNSSLSQARLQVPVTTRPNFRLAWGFPLPHPPLLGAGSLDRSHRCWDKGFSGFHASLLLKLRCDVTVRTRKSFFFFFLVDYVSSDSCVFSFYRRAVV